MPFWKGLPECWESWCLLASSVVMNCCCIGSELYCIFCGQMPSTRYVCLFLVEQWCQLPAFRFLFGVGDWLVLWAGGVRFFIIVGLHVPVSVVFASKTHVANRADVLDLTSVFVLNMTHTTGFCEWRQLGTQDWQKRKLDINLFVV